MSVPVPSFAAAMKTVSPLLIDVMAELTVGMAVMKIAVQQVLLTLLWCTLAYILASIALFGYINSLETEAIGSFH